jgi:predicted nucleic acid-binding protein
MDGMYILLLSVPLLLEYEAALKRPEHLSVIGLDAGEIDAVLDALSSVAEQIPLRFLWRPQLKDAGDEMVLETAVNGRADVLVSFNQRHLSAAARRFGIATLTPASALGEIREHGS